MKYNHHVYIDDITGDQIIEMRNILPRDHSGSPYFLIELVYPGQLNTANVGVQMSTQRRFDWHWIVSGCCGTYRVSDKQRGALCIERN